MNIFDKALILIDGSSNISHNSQDSFIEENPYEAGFYAFFEERIKPILNHFEEARLKALKEASRRFRVCLFVCIASISALISSMFLQAEFLLDFLYILSPIVIFAMIFWFHGTVDGMHEFEVKARIFPQVLSFFGDFNYSVRAKNLTSSFVNSRILPIYNLEISEDLVEASYKGVKINFFETTLKNVGNMRGDNILSGNNAPKFFSNAAFKSNMNSSGFKGLMIDLEINKKFKGLTLIRAKKAIPNKIIDFIAKDASVDKIANLCEVRLEDPKFMSMFDVEASDQIEARYLLTTSFINRLLEVNKVFGGVGFDCSFYDNKFLMMIPTKNNLFEIGSVFEKININADLKRLIAEIQMIFSIIDELKLNQNIGL